MQHYSQDPVVDKSLRHSLKDAAAFALMTGIGETYLSAFALFLRASTAQIGLLAALPPLLASIAQVASAWLGHRTGHRKGIIIAGATLQAFTWIPLLLLPLVFQQHAMTLLISCAAICLAGANLAAPQWSSLMGDLVPERRRGWFFGIRTRVTTAVTFSALMCGGLLLNLTAARDMTVWGFVVIFLMAAVARFVSVYQLAQMYDPPGHVAALDLSLSREWARRLYSSNAVRFSVFFALMQFAVASASPYFTVFMLRDIGFSYLEFTIITGTAVLAQFVTMARWGRISDLFGNRRVITAAGSLICALPLLWLVSTNFWYLLAVQTLSGFAWAGFTLAASNFIYDLMVPQHRTSYLAVHSVLASLGVFCGAMTGGYLGSVTPTSVDVFSTSLSWVSPLWSVFILSSVLRTLVMLLLIPKLKEARRVRHISLTQLVFRVIRVNALAGVVFDIVVPRRKRQDKEDS
jgi:MFS family permease